MLREFGATRLRIPIPLLSDVDAWLFASSALQGDDLIKMALFEFSVYRARNSLFHSPPSVPRPPLLAPIHGLGHPGGLVRVSGLYGSPQTNSDTMVGSQ